MIFSQKDNPDIIPDIDSVELTFDTLLICEAGIDKLIIGNSGLSVTFALTGVNYLDYTPESNCTGIASVEDKRKYAITFCGAIGAFIDWYEEGKNIPEELAANATLQGQTNECFYKYMLQIFGNRILKGVEDEGGVCYSFFINLNELMNNTELIEYFKLMNEVALNQRFTVRNKIIKS